MITKFLFCQEKIYNMEVNSHNVIKLFLIGAFLAINWSKAMAGWDNFYMNYPKAFRAGVFE
jgi:hypothetical protein